MPSCTANVRFRGVKRTSFVRHGRRCASADHRQLIVCGRQARCLEGLIQQKIDVGRFKSGELDLKSDIDQTLQLNGLRRPSHPATSTGPM